MDETMECLARAASELAEAELCERRKGDEFGVGELIRRTLEDVNRIRDAVAEGTI